MFKQALYISLALSTLPALGETATNEPPAIEERLEQASRKGLTSELRELAAELRLRVAADGGDRAARYNLGYAAWRICQHLMPETGADEQRDEALEEAREQLQALLEIDADDVEALSLLSAVLGQMIGESSIRGMTLGPRAGAYISKAARLAPENPRVALQQGISAFHTPSLFGGGLDKSRTALERAAMLFAEQDSTPWPNWGEIDALTWLGQVYARQGLVEEARAAYQRVLALEPDSGWIRYELLPKLESEAK